MNNKTSQILIMDLKGYNVDGNCLNSFINKPIIRNDDVVGIILSVDINQESFIYGKVIWLNINYITNKCVNNLYLI